MRFFVILLFRILTATSVRIHFLHNVQKTTPAPLTYLIIFGYSPVRVPLQLVFEQ